MKKGEKARLVSTESLASLKSAVAQIPPERDPVVSKDNNVVIDFRDSRTTPPLLTMSIPTY